MRVRPDFERTVIVETDVTADRYHGIQTEPVLRRHERRERAQKATLRKSFVVPVLPSTGNRRTVLPSGERKLTLST